jgi:hypothetical protein
LNSYQAKRSIPHQGKNIQLDQIEPDTAPLFSVIVPLEFHRGQLERCCMGWRTQTMPKRQYEMILVVPPGFPNQEKLSALLGPGDRLEYSTERHDIGLCAIGAARARGQFLFFTESHCWPEADILEKCLQAFTTHPEWGAFSCGSKRITHNRLSEAEADMYEADIEYGMKIHPWRKVMDACFVTRRDIYEECGVLKSELGHFAEWVLSANYARHGHKVEYVPDACVHHYYIGRFAELRTFTRDFTTGEMRYFATEAPEPGGHLLEIPPEWICQGNWDRRLAQGLLSITMHEMLAPSVGRLRHRLVFLRMSMRWLMPALAGVNPALAGAAAKVGLAHAATSLAILVGSKARLSAAFRSYVATLISHQRLACLKSQHRTATQRTTISRVGLKPGLDVFASENAGFHPIETFQGTKFRWSEPAAIMPTWAPAGRHRICIEVLPFRSLVHQADLRFYFDEKPLPARDVSIGPETIEINLDLGESRGSTLAWICRPLSAKGDRRWLGLPVKRIVWHPISGASASKAAARVES